MFIRVFLFTFSLMRVLRVSSLSEERNYYKIQENNSVSVNNNSEQVPSTKCPNCDPLDGKCNYTNNCEDEYDGVLICVFIVALLSICLIITALIYHQEDDLELKIGHVKNITEPVISSDSIYSSQSLEKLNDNNSNDLLFIKTVNVRKYKLKSFNSIEDNTIINEFSMKNINFPVYLREVDTEIIINKPLYDEMILNHDRNFDQTHSEKLQNNFHYT